MKGVIYLNRVRQAMVSNSEFQQNDPGPIFHNWQLIGPVKYILHPEPGVQWEAYKLNRASAIFIDHGIDIQISNCGFSNNAPDFVKPIMQA